MARQSNIKPLEKNRKQLRNHSTSAEAVLWLKLKKSQLDNHKFRRQHSIGPFILDFYCSQAKLAIELDGSVHNDILVQGNDGRKIEYMQELGIEILHIENKYVFENIEGLLDYIKSKLHRDDEPVASPFE